MKNLLVTLLTITLLSCGTDDVAVQKQRSKLVKKNTLQDNTSRLYQYNTDSTLSLLQYISGNSQAIYAKHFFYDSGLIKRIESYDHRNKLDFEEVYVHSNGKLKEILAKNHDPEMISEPNDIVIRFTYTNNLITTIEYDGSGAQFKEFLKYDSVGNIVVINREYNPENAISNTETKYTYDGKKNAFNSLDPILLTSKFLDFELISNVNNPVLKVTKFLSTNDSIQIASSYTYDSDYYPVSVVNGTKEFTYEYY